MSNSVKIATLARHIQQLPVLPQILISVVEFPHTCVPRDIIPLSSSISGIRTPIRSLIATMPIFTPWLITPESSFLPRPFNPASMLRGTIRAQIHGLLDRVTVTIISVLILNYSFVYSFAEPIHPIHQRRSTPLPKSNLQVNSTTCQGSHYLKNTYLRSDLRDNQTGLPLSIQLTVLDSHSCAPVENALVEIWGANTHGAYSGGFMGAQTPRFDCSSWLRGGLATDSDGTVKFETIYPGPEPKRAPALHAIIRTDWYEHGKNKTIDSDSTPFAAAIGKIFFPNDVNGQVYEDPNYKDKSMNAVKNEADACYKAQSASWKAETEPFTGRASGAIRAHVTIAVNVSEPAKFKVESAPYQCRCENSKPNGNAPAELPLSEDSSSAASFSRPAIIVLTTLHLMMFYVSPIIADYFC